MHPPALSVRTPDKLERGMVVQLIPGAHPETIVRTNLLRGKWMVRTTTNLHRCPPDLLVTVVAECVDGIGYVTAAAVA